VAAAAAVATVAAAAAAAVTAGSNISSRGVRSRLSKFGTALGWCPKGKGAPNPPEKCRYRKGRRGSR
jgi:hypothetical protein